MLVGELHLLRVYLYRTGKDGTKFYGILYDRQARRKSVWLRRASDFRYDGVMFIDGQEHKGEFSIEDIHGNTYLRMSCAWCGKLKGYKEGLGQTGQSDGICDDCRLKLESNLPKREKVNG